MLINHQAFYKNCQAGTDLWGKGRFVQLLLFLLD